MISPQIMERLSGIHQMLMGAYNAGAKMSTSSKGNERETFIDKFLSEVLTPQYRFGSGDAIDQMGNHSGQLDVVVEYPFVPSLPIVGSHKPRLYLAEGIAAVIEIKSDISSQWSEVENTISRLSPLRRHFGPGISFGVQATPYIPFFAVGYTGWKTLDPVVKRLKPGFVEGILVIDTLNFACTNGNHAINHPAALWQFISSVHFATCMGGSTAAGVPINYIIE